MNRSLCLLVATAAVVSVFSLSASAASVQVIDFEAYQHGEVLADSPTTPSPIFSAPGVSVTLTVDNNGNNDRPTDLAVVFDTTLTSSADPDLHGPPNTSWTGGNLAPDVQLGKVLIIQEHRSADDFDDINNDGALNVGDIVTDAPDDEGRRPAGLFSFYFSQPVESFGFDVVDVELNSESDKGYFAAVEDVDGTEVKIGFNEFLAGGAFEAGPAGDPKEVVFGGDNTANRIFDSLLTLDTLNAFDPAFGGSIARVDLRLGGSGAIDNVRFSVPDPPTTPIPMPAAGPAGLLLLLTVGGLRGLRRGRA